MRTEDGCIIQECLNGKPEAFGMLVDKYKAGVYAFVYGRLGHFQDAQDVTQEVFEEAYRGLHSLRRWESFVFWIYRIARNLCADWVRAESRRPDSEFISDQAPDVLEAPSLDSYREGYTDESLREALDALPGTYREVLMLHYFGGMSIKEMARAIGASPGAIGMRLSRARAQLKEEIVVMIDTAFEGQRLQAGFTFRIVEAVKRIKINPMPRMAGVPLGLSLAVGIFITVLSLNPHISIPSDMAIPAGLPLPVETKALKTGEIPVDILKTSEISVISSKQGDNDGGEPQLQDSQNVFMLAPHAKGTWTQKSNMLTPRSHLSIGKIGDSIYAIGGVKGNMAQNLSTNEVFDTINNTWGKRAEMPTLRFGLSVEAVNGKFYAIGGSRIDGKRLSTVEEYDPKTDSWSRKADMPTPRRFSGSTVLDDKIYIIGGTKDANELTPAVEVYDPQTDTWDTTRADLPIPITTPGCCTVGRRIYFIGGAIVAGGNVRQLSTVWEYDPEMNIWEKKADMPTPRGCLSLSVVDKRIYAMGGYQNGNIIFGTTEVYDTVKDEWEQKVDMHTKRCYFDSAVVRGKIYVVGGTDSWPPNSLSSVEEYIPEDSQHAIPSQGKLPTTWGEVKQ